MLSAFFALAAQSPSRQLAFRKLVVAHLLLLGGLIALMLRLPAHGGRQVLGNALLVAGIVEGSLLVGWRLTQLPKSQALEFLLVSPLRPSFLLLAEVLVGLTQLALVTLSGLPVLALLAGCGAIDLLDLIVLIGMPLTWGALTGLGLTMWAYEAAGVRRVGERVVLGLILLYLIVGVLAGENLSRWLIALPPGLASWFLTGFADFHTHNPFGVMRWWMEQDIPIAWERALGLELAALVAFVLVLWRAATRLQAHFHERHYQPAASKADQVRQPVGNQPLSWWAVKRVSEYSGRINFWLAGGFCLLYAIFLLAGDQWPAWLGRRVFELCDNVGGVAGICTGLVLLAAVPAAFQYGLWDSNAQDRCRRLELLLLTRLASLDYWNAAAAAAWRRGRGYFGVALMLWAAAVCSGRLAAPQAAVAAATGVLLWGLYFALGFRAFARGAQANGLGMLLTVGLPLAAYLLARTGLPTLSDLLPPGGVFRAATEYATPSGLAGPVLTAVLALFIAQRALLQCDAELRRWYDRHHGSKVMS